MTKYIKNDVPELGILNQSEISDEAAALWRSKGNGNISDTPWSDLEIVRSFIVDIKPSGPDVHPQKESTTCSTQTKR